MGYVFKFAYDGSEFSGYQKGNGENSVEDTILRRLRTAGIDCGIRSAARTDRGVSAVGNAVYIDSDERPEKISGIVNSGGKNLFLHSYAVVDSAFRPRHCDMKVYRYIIASESVQFDVISSILHQFEGTHDFSCFSRTDGRRPIRTINRIDVRQVGNMVYVDFYGQSFLWNQIRSIIAYSLRNQESNPHGNPFDLKSRFSGLADPYSLVLMDIFYAGVEFISVPFPKFPKMLREEVLHTEVKLVREKFLLDRVTGKEPDFSYTFNHPWDHRL
jgi:tRNA pseudouridine38-40 synthase